MPIRIDWIDSNGAGADMSIYRSTSPMLDEGNLPAPIAVVPSSNNFYIDETAVRNQLYHYRLATPGVPGSQETVITPNKPLAFMPYTGPGPQKLLRGTWECGYFGRLSVGELFSAADMIDYAGVAGMVENTAANEWHKFVYKGKILFFPKFPLASTFTWRALYEAGLVFGDIPNSQWPAYAKTTFGTIAQNRKITKNEHSFIVRCPTSRANPLNTGSTTADITGGEVDRFISQVCRIRVYADPEGRPQVDDVDYPQFCFFTTDLLTTGFCINRGYNQGPDYINVGLNSTVTNPAHGWRPVLALEL